MEQIKDLAYTSEMNEVEIAYKFLRSLGEKQNYRIIIEKILAEKGLEPTPQIIASIHTQINLDSRFVYLGQGEWGLRDWTSGKVVRKIVNDQKTSVKRRSLIDEFEPYESSEGSENYNQISDDDDEENDNDEEWED